MKKILLLLAILATTVAAAQTSKVRTQTAIDLQQKYDLWPSDGQLFVQDIFDLAKAKSIYPACFTAWEREKIAGGMTLAQADQWVMGMTLFEAAWFDALWTGVGANPGVGPRGYCGSRNKIILPLGDYYTIDQLDYAFNDIGGASNAYGGTVLHLWNDKWRGNDTDRVLLGAFIDGSDGIYSYHEGTQIHDLRLIGGAGTMKDPKYTITGLRAWSFGSGSNVRNIFVSNCDIGLDVVVGTPFTGSDYIGSFSNNVAAIAISGGAGATISFETVESDDCPALFLIRKGVTGGNRGMAAGALLNVQTIKIECAISPPELRIYKPEVIVDGSGWLRLDFSSISYATGNVFIDALFNLRPDVNTSSLRVGDLRVYGGDNTAALLHDDRAKKTWLYDNGWRSKLITFDWYSDGNAAQFRSWPGTATVVDAPHQGRLGYLNGDPSTGRPIGAFDRVAGTPRWDNVTGSSIAPAKPPVVVTPPVVVPPSKSDTIAYYTFDKGTVSHITANVGDDLLATYAVGGPMAGGVLTNTGKGYVNYASYPVAWNGVSSVTIIGYTYEKGSRLLTTKDGSGYVQIQGDGSVVYKHGNSYDTVALVGTVKSGVKTDLRISLTAPMDIGWFGPSAGGGGCWGGTMEGLLIQ